MNYTKQKSHNAHRCLPVDLLSTLSSSDVPCVAFELCNRIYPYPLSLFSQGYHLQTTRDMRPHPSVTLDPATFHPPPFRSRNQSYMRAVSTLSQASCVSQVSLTTYIAQRQHLETLMRAYVILFYM